jgi:hypothetical protein
MQNRTWKIGFVKVKRLSNQISKAFSDKKTASKENEQNFLLNIILFFLSAFPSIEYNVLSLSHVSTFSTCNIKTKLNVGGEILSQWDNKGLS